MQQGDAGKVRRIQRISVTNLFGIFNHSIPLKVQDRITIIRGPNGFGKTMILKLLHALFSPSNQLLFDMPFDEFRVDFEDNTSFWVSKTTSQSHELAEEEHLFEQEITFHFTGRKSFSQRSKSLQEQDVPFPLAMVEDLIPSLTRVGKNTWRMAQTGESLSLEDVLELFGDHFPRSLTPARTKVPEWLVEMRKSVSIRLIETQRLLSSTRLSGRSARDRKVTPEYAITEDSGHLVGIISRKLAESGTLSQSLDSTFPARVIRPTAQQSLVTEDELLDKLEKLERKRSQLMAIGLLSQETETGVPIDSEQKIEHGTKAVLAVYAEDTEQKLGIFDELAQKIDLFTTIINTRFLYKTMTINKEQGFVFTTRNDSNLPIENLSSGEQHELVLFYELLFRVSPGSLILIDEPELSLHVVWQEQFLKDVQQVTQLTNIDLILATHSVDIIQNRRDLEVLLKGPENGRR